ncbi:PAS domain S-box protein [candidate division KSB1 bacterium]|nr:PAS domain S-box protein [candidate division KSB1 bacterium]
MELRRKQPGKDTNEFYSRKKINLSKPKHDTSYKFHELITTTPHVLISSFDIHGHIKKWNNASEELYGYAADEILYQRIQDTILHPDEVQLFEIFLRDIRTTLQSCIPYEWKTLTQDGSLRIVRSTLSPIVENGNCTEVYCISVDITSQKEAEKELRETQAQYMELFENSTDLLTIVDTDGNIIAANRAMAEFTGYPKETILKMNISELIPIDDLELIKRRLTEHVRKKISSPIEYKWEKHDGQQGILEVNVQVIREKNKPTAFQIAARNITERRMLENELNETYRQIIETLIDFIDTKDIYTGKHSQRLVKDCVYLAKQLHLAERDIHDLEVAAILHDVGKIKIPKRILNKFGTLTPDERRILNQHAATGAHAVEKIPKFYRVSKIIRHHHERYDGTGYPDQIKGSAIPVESRILAVVDAFDAMTNDRPFRKAISIAEAIDELECCKGTQFDPLIVDIYLDYITRRYDGEIHSRECLPQPLDNAINLF